MERLTASEHVINEYTFCGQSVITDYVHGSVNSLVKQPHLQSKDRLDLAYRLVKGLEDIHGIDYKSGNNVTFVHNDINPANVGKHYSCDHILSHHSPRISAYNPVSKK